MTNCIWYSSSDEEEPERYALDEFPSEQFLMPEHQEQTAIMCADDFSGHGGGIKRRWPRNITLYASEDGPPVASFIVEQELTPTFYATRKVKAA